MHQAGHLAAEFGLDGDDEPPAAQGDDGVLQIFLIGGRADELVELLAHPRGGGTDFAADIRKLSEAASAISSSDRMEVVILSSRYLLGKRASKRQSMEHSTPSHRFLHSRTERMTRSTSAMRSGSPMESEPPAWARRRAPFTF